MQGSCDQDHASTAVNQRVDAFALPDTFFHVHALFNVIGSNGIGLESAMAWFAGLGGQAHLII